MSSFAPDAKEQTTMNDPTHREMFDYLAAQAGGEEDVRFNIEEAIYWFASHYHGGQWSNLYSALSTSEFTPSPISNGPSDPLFYDMLVTEFGKD
jgi:hypothetical protein